MLQLISFIEYKNILKVAASLKLIFKIQRKIDQLLESTKYEPDSVELALQVASFTTLFL